MKKQQSEIKPIKTGKQLGTTYSLGCNNLMHNFRPQEVKMTNKVLVNQTVLFVGQISQGFSHKNTTTTTTKIQRFTNSCYKTNMLNYCVKCRKNTENLGSKTFKIKNNRLVKVKMPCVRN